MKKIHEKYIIDEQGNKSAVIVPIDEYNELMEDLHDLAVVAERKNSGTLTLDDLKRSLQ